MHSLAPSHSDLKNAKFAHVLGKPIKHSLSPLLHNTAYRYLNLPFEYSAIEADEIECLAQISKLHFGEVFGVSFTMPLKEIAYKTAQVKSDLVNRTKSANTMVYRSGELVVENTDVTGITRTLINAEADLKATWYVIGTGATARSAICALLELNVNNIVVLGRNETKLQELADLFQIEVLNLTQSQIISNVISTIPEQNQKDYSELLVGSQFLLDVNYNIWPTQFADQIKSTGGRAVSGLPMLVFQAIEQIEIMTGKQIEARILFEALTKKGYSHI